MAKKRASAKPKGLDADNRVIDLGKYSSFIAAEEKRLQYGHFGTRSKTDQPTKLQRQEVRVASRNLTELSLHGPESKKYIGKPIPLPSSSSSLAGRTTDAGTKSLLDGMKNFMKSGFKGGIRGGGGGRLGTRL